MNTTDEILWDIPKGLISWCQFHNTDRILLVDDKSSLKDYFDALLIDGKIAEFDYVSFKDVCGQNETVIDSNKKVYDVVIVTNVFERSSDVRCFLSRIKETLKQNGRMFLAANNRLGIRYFCGDRDPYTNRNFDSIEDYRRYAVKKEDNLEGRMYDQAQLEDILLCAGFKTRKYYSVFPDLEHPSFVFSHDYTPNEELNTRVFPMYYYPDTVFLEEEYLYSGLIQNGIFHKMANAYLIECYAEENARCQDILHVTMSIDRGREDAMFTVIRESEGVKVVEKKAVYPEGEKRLQTMCEYAQDLVNHGVRVVDATLTEGVYRMPFIEAETALSYLRRLAHKDKQLFEDAMDRFYETILSSSEIFHKVLEYGNTEDHMQHCNEVMHLKKGYLDLVPLNCFVEDDTYLFYDQEFCMEDCPVGVLVARLVDLTYLGDYELERILPHEYFYKKYDVFFELDTYRRIGDCFLRKLRKEKELSFYHNQYRRNYETVHSNRQRINYSEVEYQKRFVDIFKDLNDRKLILFGSGRFTKRFISMYGKDYPIAAIIDNCESRWGEELDGIKIEPPAMLLDIKKEDYKVLICIKSYLSVAKQLESMGIDDYGIFDSSRSYPRMIQNANVSQNQICPVEKAKKKYQVGYVAGVFDMFHIGHVNLLRKAKEQCDFLIVGVVPDEEVYHQKKKYPIISCADRVEVIRACRYADQVEALPVGYGGIRDAYKMYQFDAMFSGDDHGDNPEWLSEQDYLKKRGVDLVFFDYTEGVSSTMLRADIQK